MAKTKRAPVADGTKVCFKCDRELHVTEFYPHPYMRDGRLRKCIECAKADVTANRDKNIERIRAYDRERGARSNPETVRRWYENGGRQKVRCHAIVYRAIKRGDLTPKPCEVCGSTENINAHHDDYTKALD